MITNVKSYTFSRTRRKNHHLKTLMTLNDPPLMTPEEIIADYNNRVINHKKEGLAWKFQVFSLSLR